MTKAKRKRLIYNLVTFGLVIAAFIILQNMIAAKAISRSLKGQLVPICAWIVMAVSLNLVIGFSGELSLGHAGFMSVGAFTGIIASQSLASSLPSAPLRLLAAILVGALFAGIFGFLIGIPVLRLRGDYLAIVTLAFGEIIKELITCLLVGVDEEYPRAGGLRRRELLLPDVAQPLVAEDLVGVLERDVERAVRRERIDHHDLVGPPDAFQAPFDVADLVSADYADGYPVLRRPGNSLRHARRASRGCVAS